MQYAQHNARSTARRVCQEVALRALYGSILHEQAVEPCRFDSLAEGRRRALLSHVPHAVAAVLDQGNACKLADT